MNNDLIAPTEFQSLFSWKLLFDKKVLRYKTPYTVSILVFVEATFRQNKKGDEKVSKNLMVSILVFVEATFRLLEVYKKALEEYVSILVFVEATFRLGPRIAC